jgi:hypothetical protein
VKPQKFYFLSQSEIKECIEKRGIDFAINYISKTLKYSQWQETKLWENSRMRKKAQELSLKNLQYEKVLNNLKEKYKVNV